MAAIESISDDGPKLFLGTEAFAMSEGGLARLGVTHRLSCLMTKEEEAEWMRYAGSLYDKEVGVASIPPPILAPVLSTTGSACDESSQSLIGRFPMADEDAFGPFAEPLLESGAAFIHEAMSKSASITVYVHCSQGVSRSATMVMWYLVRHRGFSALEAAIHVKSRRIKVSPGDEFVNHLLGLEERVFRERGNSETNPVSVKLSERTEVLAVLRKPWLPDFQAGRIKLSQMNRIL